MHRAVATHSFKGFPKPDADRRRLILESSIEEGHLLDNVELVRRQLPDPRQVLESLCATAFRHKPSGRLPQPERADEQKASRYKLHGERNQPLLVARRHGLGERIVDPNPNQPSNLPAKFIDTDESASYGRWS